jgi:GT2 family glycosyltransferase
MSISSTNRVAIIVLNWNGLKDTIECLRSLEKSDFEQFDIIVVDNASSEPNTITTLEQYGNDSRREITLLSNHKNLGFSGGVNTGIRHALSKGYSHIALINNDAVVEPTWIALLHNAFSCDDSVGAVTGSLIHKNKKTIDSTGEIYTVWGLPFPRLRDRSIDELPESGYIFAATGGGTMYHRRVFESVGLFDETFFAYYEDVDFGFRAQLSGWKSFYEKEAIAYHTQGASSGKIAGFTTKQAIRNLPILFIKNVPGSLVLKVGIRFWPAYTLITLKAMFSTNFKPALTGWLQGVWLFWAHGVVQRVQIQNDRVVSDKTIDNIIWHDLPPEQIGLRRLRNMLMFKSMK